MKEITHIMGAKVTRRWVSTSIDGCTWHECDNHTVWGVRGCEIAPDVCGILQWVPLRSIAACANEDLFS